MTAPRCPMCGAGMSHNHIRFARPDDPAYPLLWFWHCEARCGCWLPCDGNGNIPPWPTPESKETP
jgi:hypothetical protein